MNTRMRRAVHPSHSVLLLLALVLGPPSSPAAGQQPARVLTLEEALELAESRSEQMAIAQAGVDRAAGAETRARSDLFPQLSGSVAYDRALASEFSGLFDSAGGAPCPPFVADTSGTIDQRLAELERAVDCGATGAPADGGFTDFEELPFGRRNTYRFNLSFSQNLFSGGRIGAQSAVAAAGRRTAEIALASTRAQLLLDVIRAYYDAALSERLLAIADATYDQANATFEQTRLAYQAGSQPEFELLRAQVSRDNLRPTIIRSRADRDIAMLRLRQLVDMPRTERITLAAPLEGDTLAPPAGLAAELAEVEAALAEMDRAPIRQARTAVEQSEAAVDVTRAQRLPSVSLTSSYGQVAYPSDAFPGLDDFRRNWTVGALVQVPILTGGRLRAEEAMARADARIAEAQLQQARELALLDSQSALEELRAALASWDASAGTVQQARRAYEIAELRYREGVSTQLELSDSRLLLAQAQATRAQAGRDLQIARARVALLPDLPLGATGASGMPTGGASSGTSQQTPRTQTPPLIRTSGTQTTGAGGLPGGGRF